MVGEDVEESGECGQCSSCQKPRREKGDEWRIRRGKRGWWIVMKGHLAGLRGREVLEDP